MPPILPLAHLRPRASASNAVPARRRSGWRAAACTAACAAIAGALITGAAAAHSSAPESATPTAPAPPPSSLPVAIPFAPGDQPAAKGYLGDLRLVKSMFDDICKSGKDPFFPNTERCKGGAQTNNVELLVLSDLALKGTIVSASKRLAIINRYTLAEGETHTIRVNNRVYEVQCIEVRETSAVISVRKQKRELFLRPGLGS